MSISKLRWRVTPPLTFFFHSRRWCNENITLLIKSTIFYDFCSLIDSLNDAIAQIAHSIQKVQKSSFLSITNIIPTFE